MLVVGVYAGDAIGDARRDKRRPRASLRARLPSREAERYAALLQAEAGGQAAHVVFLALDWDTAMARYRMEV